MIINMLPDDTKIELTTSATNNHPNFDQIMESNQIEFGLNPSQSENKVKAYFIFNLK